MPAQPWSTGCASNWWKRPPVGIEPQATGKPAAVAPIFDGEKEGSDCVGVFEASEGTRPAGTLRLLEIKVVELGIVDRASDSTIGKHQEEVGDPLSLVLVVAGKKVRRGRSQSLWQGPRPGSGGGCAGSSSLLRSTGGTPDAAPLASHWRVQARLCFSIRPSVQTRMAVRQVGVRKICADASKFVSCARFMGIRTLGRFESEGIAAKGCFDPGSKRPTPPRNRSGGSPSRPTARADAR